MINKKIISLILLINKIKILLLKNGLKDLFHLGKVILMMMLVELKIRIPILLTEI